MFDAKKKKNNPLIRKWAGLFLVGVVVIVLLFIFKNPKTVTEKQTIDTVTSTAVQQIKVSEYDELASNPKVFVLDVHVPEQNHLPNTDATIPFDKIRDNAINLPADKTTPILVYCRSGGMSKQVSAELVSMGYQTVYDLAGGRNAYIEAKAPIELTPKVKDLGKVVYGEVATAQFELTNNSMHTVEITRVSTSCSCTKAEVVAKSLAPGVSTIVNVSFDPAVHKDDHDLGDVTRTIFVNTNHPEVDEVTASIKAQVVKK